MDTKDTSSATTTTTETMARSIIDSAVRAGLLTMAREQGWDLATYTLDSGDVDAIRAAGLDLDEVQAACDAYLAAVAS